MTTLYRTSGGTVDVWDTSGTLVWGASATPGPDPEPLTDLPDTIPGGERLHPYAFPTAAPWTVPNAAITPTPDGTGSAVHPSVVDMVAETGAPFRGFRYWMAITPYAGSNDQKENPSVLVSNHGWEWQVPQGLTNPIDTPLSHYYSDTEMKWDSETAQFVMYWRHQANGQHMATSADGVHWAKHGIVIPHWEISISLAQRGPNDWWSWSGGFPSSNVRVDRAASPQGPWVSHSTNSVFRNEPGSPGRLWHYSVLWDEQTQHFFMAASDRNWSIFPAVSVDGVTWDCGPHVLRDGTTYRPAIVPSDDPAWFDIWYSYHGASDLGIDWWTKHTRLPRALWTDLI